MIIRQNRADAVSSDEFDTESSTMSNKPIQNNNNRRSRSYSRSRMKERRDLDDRSVSNNVHTKRTTFVTDKDENTGGCGSIKSNSSYDTSKISFQDFMLNTLEQIYSTY